MPTASSYLHPDTVGDATVTLRAAAADTGATRMGATMSPHPFAVITRLRHSDEP